MFPFINLAFFVLFCFNFFFLKMLAIHQNLSVISFSSNSALPVLRSRARLPSCRDVELEEEEEERTGFHAAIPLEARGPYARRSPSLSSPAATEVDSGCHVTPSSLHARAARQEDADDLLQEVGEARALLEQLQQLVRKSLELERRDKRGRFRSALVERLPIDRISRVRGQV